MAHRGKLVAGLDGTPLYVNAAALSLLGVNRESVGGVHVLELIAPLDGPGHTPGYEQLQVALREHEAAAGLEVECRGPFGAARRLVVDVEPLLTAGGAIEALGLSFADIGSNFWRDVALRTLSAASGVLLNAASEAELLQSTCDLIVRDGVYRLAWIGFAGNDDDFSVTIAATAGVKGYIEPGFVSWSERDPTGQGPTGAALRTGLPQVCNDFANDPRMAPWRRRAASCGLRSTVVYPFAVDEDEIGMVAIYAAEPNGFDQRVRDVLAILAENIPYGIRSLRTQARNAVAAARFEALLHASSLLVSIRLPSGEPLFQSEAMLRLTGGVPFELDDIHPDDRATLDTAWRRTGADLREMPASVRLRDTRGRWRRLVGTCVPTIGATGELVSIVTILADVTEVLELEERLSAAARLDAVSNIAAGVAHDVKNLLLAMVASAALLEGSPTPESREILESLHTAGRDANALLRRLVSLGAEPAAVPVATDLNEIAAGAARILKPSLEPGRRLAVETLPSPAHALIDPIALERAIVNLAANAHDALAGPGTITLAVTRPAEGRVAIAVTDTGCGIEPEILERLWDPFFTTKPPGKGTGLGLPSARSAAIAAGGDIDVQTVPGAGSTFTLWLPELER